MIVLQAGIDDGRMLVWGETAVTAGPRALGRKAVGVPSHPFAVGAGAWGQVFPDDPIASAASPRTVVLRLPIHAGRPVPSDPLLGEPPPADSRLDLAPWRLPAWPYRPSRFLELLDSCREGPLLRPGLAAGTTLTYWQAALRFARGLVVREQFLPGVRRLEDGYAAVWLPHWAGPDRTRFRELAAAMPVACRAIGTAARLRSADEVLTEFLEIFVDRLVRSAQPALPAPDVPGGLHDRWVRALRCEQGELALSPPEFAELFRTLDAWRRPLTLAAEAGFRLGFRLEEPPKEEPAPDDFDPAPAVRRTPTIAAPNSPAVQAAPAAPSVDGEWTVRYLLQADDDPSLIVPLADYWKARPRAEAKPIPLPGREFVLASLGQAAKLCREVDATLNAAAPTGFVTDSAGAQRFLAETASVLRQAGFALFLPAWWSGLATKNVAVTAVAHTGQGFSVAGGKLSLEELVKFEWRVAIGDVELTLAELETLARLKTSLVRLRGQWVQVDPAEIKAALEFRKRHPTTTGTVRDALRLTLTAEPGPQGLRVRKIHATGALGTLLESLRGERSLVELPPPADLKATLRPYQVRGYSWLTFLRRCGLGACLADDMGLGKSIQMLAAIRSAISDGETRPILLVCPTSVVGHWRKEAARFLPNLRVTIHHGLKRKKGESFAAEAAKHQLVVTSYALLQRDIADFKEVAWGGAILDEAQNIKNPSAKTSQAARELKAEFRVALTGTPVENHVGDLWSISQFLNPGLLGNKETFRREFLTPIQTRQDADAADRLKRLTGPIVLRRLKSDTSIIADLPEKSEAKIYCTLTKEQAGLYATVTQELAAALEGEEGFRRKGLILGALSKLKQVCNHPAQFLGDRSGIGERSGKVNRLTEMVDELLSAGDRALIFTQFTEMGDLLKKHLEETFGREVPFLHGGVPQAKRESLVTRFQNTSAPDSPRMFLISLKAGGTGLTLTAANHVFHFDRWWNPAVENQATDRAFRIGQTRRVQVHKFVCVGTLEEKIDEMIEAKSNVAGRVVGSGEDQLTELSNTQLRELLTLRPDAVEE